MIPSTLHGDETGLLKIIEYNSDDRVGKVKSIFGQQSREFGIQRIHAISTNQVVLALKDTSCVIWDGTNINPFIEGKGQQIKGLCGFNNRIITCTDKGLVEVSQLVIDEDEEDHLITTFNVNGKVENIALNNNINLALGGNNMDLRIWNVETESIIYRAKNLPHDSLGLPIPVWMTDLKWVNENIIYTCTAFNEIRAFDIRQQRKPIKIFSLQDKTDSRNHHLNSIAVTNSDCLAVVADGYGDVSLVDVLKQGRLIHKFNGPKGSIRTLDIHQDTRSLACAGLDRVVRMYNIDNKKLIGQCYVKQRVNVVTFNGLPQQEIVKDDNEDDDDDFWGEEEEEEDDDDQELKVNTSKRVKV